MMVSSEISNSDLSEYALFQFKNIFIYKKLYPKFSNFINSDDYIGKITSKSIGIYSGFIFHSFQDIAHLSCEYGYF